MKICSEDGCDNPHRAKGLCRTHHASAHYKANSLAIKERHHLNYMFNRASVIARTSANHRLWRELDPEGYAAYYRAANSRRRSRGSQGLSDQDKLDSVAWRKVIKDLPCYYCGSSEGPKHDDHVQPLAKGGNDHWTNIVRACQTCNLSKGTKTVEEFLASRERENTK